VSLFQGDGSSVCSVGLGRERESVMLHSWGANPGVSLSVPAVREWVPQCKVGVSGFDFM
jgi:hypothetical protein